MNLGASNLVAMTLHCGAAMPVQALVLGGRTYQCESATQQGHNSSGTLAISRVGGRRNLFLGLEKTKTSLSLFGEREIGRVQSNTWEGAEETGCPKMHGEPQCL